MSNSDDKGFEVGDRVAMGVYVEAEVVKVENGMVTIRSMNGRTLVVTAEVLNYMSNMAEAVK